MTWYRNETWSEDIERKFDEALRRAKRKSQYLRIQASTLARSHPEVALRLLDRYFALGDKFDWAQGFCDQAQAFLALGRITEAITAYEAALTREAEFPNVKSDAYIELPYLIAAHELSERFVEAVELLGSQEARLKFPVDRCKWHAAWALIWEQRAVTAKASEHAAAALAEASRDHSGFRYHAAIGLVTNEDDSVVQKLRSIASKFGAAIAH